MASQRNITAFRLSVLQKITIEILLKLDTLIIYLTHADLFSPYLASSYLSSFASSFVFIERWERPIVSFSTMC